MKPRLFAIGDIHGCFDSFKTLLEREIKLNKNDKLVLLGDYIDKGPQSKDVIDYILNLQLRGYHVIALLGNHESLLLDAYKNPTLLPKWLLNGGQQTLTSFGIQSLMELPEKYLDFFLNLALYYAHENYLFVHAGFNDDIAYPFLDDYHMLWKCRKTYHHPIFKDKVIVHGHAPITKDYCEAAVNNGTSVINLDTGAVYKDKDGYGRLTAIELITRTVYFV